MSSLQRTLLRQNLPPLPPAAFPPHGSGGRKRKKKDYSPLSWNDYFDRSENVKPSGKENIFRVYFRGVSGPVLVLLHGGGHSALSWALLAVSVTRMVNCQVVAMDIRGHGSSCTEDEDDLTAETLVVDVVDVISTIFPEESRPPIVLVGHSMGGAIAVRIAAENVLTSLVGLAVIDVVEGTALESLSSMQSFLRGRPQTFDSLEKAIEWSIRSGQLRNVESARVSMPGQLQRSADPGSSKTNDPQALSSLISHNELTPVKETDDNLADSDVQGSIDSELPSTEKRSRAEDVANADSRHVYTWRINLSKTEPFWRGWFNGLSKLFLSSAVPKVLILAGIDRLDKDLSIGQMQGKFQLQVLSGCGHSIQEDLPDKVSEIIASFLIRHKFAEPNEDFVRPFPAC